MPRYAQIVCLEEKRVVKVICRKFPLQSKKLERVEDVKGKSSIWAFCSCREPAKLKQLHSGKLRARAGTERYGDGVLPRGVKHLKICRLV